MRHRKREKESPPQKTMPAKKPAEYKAFIQWLATPSTHREPQTQEELASQIGVDVGTLSDWKKREGFWADVAKEIGDYFKHDTALAVQALKRTVLKEGKAAETKLFLQIVGYLKDDQEVTLPEDLRKAIEKINQNI